MNKTLALVLAFGVAAGLLVITVLFEQSPNIKEVKNDPFTEEVRVHDALHAVKVQQPTPDSLLERELKDDEK